MHSPTRKTTVKEQQDWKIPPCISNWKNQKGYTIPLDKRLAADGRGLQQVSGAAIRDGRELGSVPNELEPGSDQKFQMNIVNTVEYHCNTFEYLMFFFF